MPTISIQQSSEDLDDDEKYGPVEKDDEEDPNKEAIKLWNER